MGSPDHKDIECADLSNQLNVEWSSCSADLGGNRCGCKSL